MIMRNMHYVPTLIELMRASETAQSSWLGIYGAALQPSIALPNNACSYRNCTNHVLVK